MFNINGIDWRISYVAPTHNMLYRSDGSLALGMCDNDSRMIYINEILDNAYLKRVMCHEITHAAMFSYNVNLSLEQEELLADLVATYGEEIIDITNKIFKKLKGEV